MRFDYDDEQREIKGTARQFLTSRFKPEVVRRLAEEGAYDDALWEEVCELGWPGIAVGSDHGGLGLGMVELAILCEEAGYACAPLPLLSNAIAGIYIEIAGSGAQRDAWLPGIAAGTGRGAVGDVDVVLDGEGAAVLTHLSDSGLRLIEGGGDGQTLELIDQTRRYSKPPSAGGEPLEGDFEQAGGRVAVAVAAELVGLAQRALDMSVAYAKEREQFGRPIGAYQAVSHTCARMLYDVEEARSLTLYAAWAADAEPESLPLAASMAKARASDAAWDVCKSAIQVHGGIGFTWEHDLHFLLKRARADAKLFGTAEQHRDRVATFSSL